MGKRHHREMDRYKNSGSSFINQAMRGNEQVKTEDQMNLVRRIARIHQAINAHEQTRDMTVYRGIGSPGLHALHANGEAIIGEKVIDKGFLSTSKSREVAVKMAMEKPHPTLLVIHSPAGSRGVETDRYGKTEEKRSQQEVDYGDRREHVVTGSHHDGTLLTVYLEAKKRG